MKITPLVLAAFAALALPGALFGNGVRYIVSGTFPANAPTSTYCAPNARFTFTFLVSGTVPNYTPSSSPFFANAPVYNGTYAFNNTTTPFVSGTYQAANSGGNVQSVTLVTLAESTTLGFTTSPGANPGLPPLLTPPDAAGLAHFALGNLGSVPLTLNLPNPTGAALAVPVTATVVGVGVPGVTISIAGYFPAGIATTPLCAPLAGFLAEVTVRDNVRAGTGAFSLPFLFGSFSFNGTTSPCAATSYVYHADFNLQEVIVLFTAEGEIGFYTNPPTHTPILIVRSGANATVPRGVLGAGTNWAAYVAPTGDPNPVNTAVVLASVVTRAF